MAEAIKKYQEALSCFEEATKIDGNNRDSWYQRGWTLNRLGWSLNDKQKLEESINCFKQVTDSINKDDWAAWYDMGSSYWGLGDPEKAAKSYTRATEIKQDDSGSWYFLGLMLNNWACALWGKQEVEEANKKFQKAVDCYTKVIEIDKNYRLAYTEKARSLENLGRMKEAEECRDELKALPSEP